MAAETGFLIDGDLYEVPTLDSMDNDECVILYDYCGLVQEDFAPLEDETTDETAERAQKLMRHAGFWPALMHIAYRRNHRDMKEVKVRSLIGKVNRLEALSTVAPAEQEEADVVPPALTSEQPEPSLSGSLKNEHLSEKSSANGGDVSMNGSDAQASSLASTGIIR